MRFELIKSLKGLKAEEHTAAARGLIEATLGAMDEAGERVLPRITATEMVDPHDTDEQPS